MEKIALSIRRANKPRRDPATLVKTVGSTVAVTGALGRRVDPISGEPDQIAEAIQEFRDLGFRHHVIGLDPCTVDGLDHLAEVITLVDDHNGETQGN